MYVSSNAFISWLDVFNSKLVASKSITLVVLSVDSELFKLAINLSLTGFDGLLWLSNIAQSLVSSAFLIIKNLGVNPIETTLLVVPLPV